MNICVLTHTFPKSKWDTTAPFMDGLAEGLRRAGNKVVVLTPFSPLFKRGVKDQKYKIKTFKYIWPKCLHKIGYSQTLENDMKIKPIMYIVSPFFYFFAILNLFLLVKRERIDIISAHWILPNGFIASVVSFFTKIPVVSTLPGSDVYMVAKNAIFRLMGQFSIKMSKMITSNSPQLINDLKKVTKINNWKSRVIYYGVDNQDFKPQKTGREEIRLNLGVNKKDVLVFSVGRLVAKKGYKYLLQAAKLSLKKYGNIKFIIAGDGDEREFLLNYSKKLGVVSNFKFIGWIDHKKLPNYLNACDLFVLPSVRDNKGNLDDQSVSVVEAMSCGKPVVTTNFPGYAGVVRNNLNGYLVLEKNPEKISEAIINLVKSKKLRKRMGEKSRQLVNKNLTWVKIGKGYSTLFKEILDSK